MLPLLPTTRVFVLHRLLPVSLAACLLASCAKVPTDRPNVLIVVWDTVRADHLDLYGYARETAPFLTEWARTARVFEDCVSPAGYTLPSHASMFTGLLPSEHCAHNGHRWLDDEYTTLAELLRDAGYQTYLYAANPNVSAQTNLAQGFEQEEHPWSPAYEERAKEIIAAKVDSTDRSSELAQQVQWSATGERELSTWNVKATGELAETALNAWLGTTAADRPWFAVLNYMEAHRPYVPPRRYRETFMTPEEVQASYQVDRSWLAVWEYTFGLREYTPKEIELTRKTYDAALRELDDLFRSLITSLQTAGRLENTVVILVADHGESLGEHHMLDHQFSLYDTLLKVPLVVQAPGLRPGRDHSPVMNFDIFPTVLHLAGIEPPKKLRSHAVSLLAPESRRRRYSEEPLTSGIGTFVVHQAHPDFDPKPWRLRLRALRRGRYKLISRSNGTDELYDLGLDPKELRNHVEDRPHAEAQLQRALRRTVRSLDACTFEEPPPEATAEEVERLKSLGYR